MKKNRTLSLSVIIIFVLFACAKPPDDQIQQARSAVQAAEAEGALEYAPEAWNLAKQALDDLDKERQLQDKKFFLFRSYRKARSLAAEAKLTADNARTEAEQKKAQLRTAVERSIADASSLLQSARSKLAELSRAPGRLDITMLQSRLEAAGRGLDQARSELQSERFDNATTTAKSSRDIITAVLKTIEDAAAQPTSKKR